MHDHRDSVSIDETAADGGGADEGYKVRDATVSLVTANVVAIPLMLVVGLVFLAVYGWIWGWAALGLALERSLGAWRFWVAAVVGIVVHEGLHALGWVLTGGLSWREISFGVKDFTPYAHAERPMRLSSYRVGAALPGVLLGLLPWLLSLLLGSGVLMVWGAFFTVTAAGDALILWLIRRAPSDALIRDHPSRAGCEVLVPRDGAGG